MNQSSKLLLILLAVSSLSLTACSEKKPAAKTDTQIAVKVNGQPIMAAEFGFSPGLGEAAPMLKSVSASEMKLMVDLELLRQAAIESKLDQDDAIRAKIAEATKNAPTDSPDDFLNASLRKTLALAYINQQLAAIPAPAEAEVSAFYNDNPARFAEHRHYELHSCFVRGTAEKEATIKARLAKSKKFDDFERWLKASKLKHGCVPVSLDSAKADESLLQKLGDVPANGSIVEGGKDQMTITFVDAMQKDPLTLDQAKPQIMTTLTDKKRSEGYANMVKQLRDKAKIEYVPPYTASGLVVKALPMPEDKGH